MSIFGDDQLSWTSKAIIAAVALAGLVAWPFRKVARALKGKKK